MHYDPILLKIVGATLVILAVAFGTRVLRQPHVIGYLVAGILLGPQVLGLLSDRETLSRLGEVGVVFLLFFVGMETSPHKLLENWRVTFLGTTVQIAGSVFLCALIGWWLEWPVARIILMGFVISLSSTAVVLNYLRDTNQLKTQIGQDALGVLLAQDLALIPMLLVLGVLSGETVSGSTLVLQGIGALLSVALLTWLTIGKHVRLPVPARVRQDHELQLFLAFGLCLGFALLSGLFQLSAALGAFLAGMLVGVSRETNWVHHRLEPFRVVFVALFFVSVGLLVDLKFVVNHLALVVGLTLAVLLGNTVLNAAIFRLLGDPWPYSLRAGAMLAQIGEFSFVLAAVGFGSSLISGFTYQLVIAMITLTLLLSPAWVKAVDAAQGRHAT